MKKGTCIWEGLYFSESDGSCTEPQSPAGTFGASSPYQLLEFLLGSLASHGRLVLPPGWLLPTWHRWPSLCSHLGQLSGWRWPWWPLHLSHILCFFNSLLQLTFSCWSLNLWYWGVYQHWGFLSFNMYLCPCLYLESFLSFPHPWCFLCSSHTGIGEKELANQKPEQSCESYSLQFECIIIMMSLFLWGLIFIAW